MAEINSFNIGKTIQIYLPDGNPRSIKIAEITSRTVQAIFVPRSKLDIAESRSELKSVGVYFLLGDPAQDSKQSLYIGESEDCWTRLLQHNKSKDFWNNALVIVSKTQYFTKTHIKFLEWFCLTEATKASRFRLENSDTPKKPYTPEPVQADLIDNFDTIKILVSTLGYPLFDEIKKPSNRELLICQTKEVYAEGEYSEDGLIVFAGSQSKLQTTKSASASIIALRQKLIEDGILKQEDSVYKFTTNYIFASPSTAAAIVLGYSANGWRLWRYKDGKTLEDVKRNNI